jgi:hypothetical protein
MNREPLVTAGSLAGVLSAIFVLLVAFGLDIDDDKQAAILGGVAVLFPLVSPLFARSKVTPVADPRGSDGTPLIPNLDA